METVLWQRNEADLLESTEQAAESLAPEEAAHVAPSYLDQAAELVRQEELEGVASQAEGDSSQPPAVATQQDAASIPPAGAKEDDDSIEQYMSRLLSRVRGGAPPAVGTHAVSEVQPVFATPSQAKPAAPAEDNPIEPKEYVPRAQAPEQPARLSLMRELANSAANSAIHTHARQHQKRETKQKSLVALLSLIGAGSLFVVACVTGSFISLIGSMIFVAVCCVMITRAVTGGFRQLKLPSPQEIGEAQDVAINAQENEHK